MDSSNANTGLNRPVDQGLPGAEAGVGDWRERENVLMGVRFVWGFMVMVAEL